MSDLMLKSNRTLCIGGKLTQNGFARNSLKCLFGGFGYGLIEVMWRGYTHPSMVITGGLCFAMICAVNGRLSRRSVWVRSAVCAAGVTLVEFCVGMLVNRVFQMRVWDYSGEWMHLLGQICPLYAGLWFGLCLVLSFLLPKVRLSVVSLDLPR